MTKDIGVDCRGQVIHEDAPAAGEFFKLAGGGGFYDVEKTEGGESEEEGEPGVKHRLAHQGEADASPFINDAGAGIFLAEVGFDPSAEGDVDDTADE